MRSKAPSRATASEGREGTYSISALTHGITSPRDAASGLPTGRRQHKPIRFTAPVSAATPKFILALAQNELMTCTFKGFKTDPRTGAEKKAWEITLDGASVADYEMSGRPGGADTMTLSLTYQKITWTWADGGITVAGRLGHGRRLTATDGPRPAGTVRAGASLLPG